MSTRRKLWFSLSALALTLLVACVSVGLIIASLQAQVNSSFSVSYTAKKGVDTVIFGDVVVAEKYRIRVKTSSSSWSAGIGEIALKKTRLTTADAKNFIQFKPNQSGATQTFEGVEFYLDDLTGSKEELKRTLYEIEEKQGHTVESFEWQNEYTVIFNYYIINSGKEALPLALSENIFQMEGVSSKNYTQDGAGIEIDQDSPEGNGFRGEDFYRKDVFPEKDIAGNESETTFDDLFTHFQENDVETIKQELFSAMPGIESAIEMLGWTGSKMMIYNLFLSSVNDFTDQEFLFLFSLYMSSVPVREVSIRMPFVSENTEVFLQGNFQFTLG